MGFDHLMHVRNRYRNKPPNFTELAKKHKRFRELCRITTAGKQTNVVVDFKDENLVRVLSETLLEEDFNARVTLPKDYLVPRIPQRLNYVLVVEDLIELNKLGKNVVGFDIGTGPACIYPIIALRQNPTWKMYASELDPVSCGYGMANAHRNFSADQLIVFEADSDNFFKKVLSKTNKITFTMCNPPFFDTEEIDSKFSRLANDGKDNSNLVTYTNASTDDQMDVDESARSRTTAQHSELSVDGGEVGFIQKMIEESVLYGDKIGIFTTLLGVKASFRELKPAFQQAGIETYNLWTIGQGRTCRWILAWTLNPQIKLKE
ncbi:U6 small nuclear RNA (adenine-(43)-N(6))-methyltransferase [Aphelenchoides bicaudatus]|nr:U6 small nuclear RNA (adenine-(43)-N(6))-methyltransferase [Aphelenchoides bicaudatus]